MRFFSYKRQNKIITDIEITPLTTEGHILSIDVEEWYHNCHERRYIYPQTRPKSIKEELDWTIPFLLEKLEEGKIKATFFILGEIAEKKPYLVREIFGAGHEIACHGLLHYRLKWENVDKFKKDIEKAKKILEDIIGEKIYGFRAPEWSLRSFNSVYLEAIVQAGFYYDSSLVKVPLAGSIFNLSVPHTISTLRWQIIEIPPSVIGPFSIASGWKLRKLTLAEILKLRKRNYLHITIHPWEVIPRPINDLSTIAQLFANPGLENFYYTKNFIFSLRWNTILKSISKGVLE